MGHHCDIMLSQAVLNNVLSSMTLDLRAVNCELGLSADLKWIRPDMWWALQLLMQAQL